MTDAGPLRRASAVVAAALLALVGVPAGARSLYTASAEQPLRVADAASPSGFVVKTGWAARADVLSGRPWSERLVALAPRRGGLLPRVAETERGAVVVVAAPPTPEGAVDLETLPTLFFPRRFVVFVKPEGWRTFAATLNDASTLRAFAGARPEDALYVLDVEPPLADLDPAAAELVLEERFGKFWRIR